jgi:hypothetical protein
MATLNFSRNTAISIFIATGTLLAGVIPASAEQDTPALEQNVRQATPASGKNPIIYKEKAHKSSAPPARVKACNYVAAGRTPPTTRAVMCFDPKGDKLYLKDVKADGYHPEIRGQLFAGNRAGVHCYSYVPASGGWAVCDGMAKKIPENKPLFLKLYIYNKGKVISESDAIIPKT